MLERGHRLKVGDIGIVGLLTKRVSLVSLVRRWNRYAVYENPDLPETRSGI